MRLLDVMLFNMMFAAGCVKAKASKFFHEERGASDIIAVVVLVAIVVVVAVAFREKLIEFIGNIWSGISGKTADITKDVTIP